MYLFLLKVLSLNTAFLYLNVVFFKHKYLLVMIFCNKRFAFTLKLQRFLSNNKYCNVNFEERGGPDSLDPSTDMALYIHMDKNITINMKICKLIGFTCGVRIYNPIFSSISKIHYTVNQLQGL